MLRAPALSGRRYGVYGLARSGLSVLHFLARSGAGAVAWDESAEARAAAQQQFPDLTMQDFADLDLSGIDALVLSPGVPINRHPLARRARQAAIPMLCDIELFQWCRPALPPHRLVAVTGTNGKSTTVALIHHLLASAGIPTRMGGNIGLPVLDQPPLPAGGVHVLELSSYQLDLCHTLSADVAVWTNLTPDHLDRHGTMEGYFAAKARLFAMQQPGATAVIATDDPWTRRAVDAVASGVRCITVSAGDIAAHEQARWPALAGPHNAQNVAVAGAVARALGIGENTIAQGLRSFPGLPHRMEPVATIDGILFVNDSKATNPASAAPAIQAWPAIRWIVGGQAKAADLDACLPVLGAVRSAYVIGEAADLFAGLLAPHVPVVRSGTLQRAVVDAARDAAPGETVLLSPAAASFDQFRDFEARGEAFRAAVATLSAALSTTVPAALSTTAPAAVPQGGDAAGGGRP